MCAGPGRRRFYGGDAGSVTAEFATVVPAVVILLALCLSAVQVAVAQVRVADAAADAARIAARGEGDATATAHAGGLIEGARVVIAIRGMLVCATVSAPAVAGGPFSSMTVSAESCALGSSSP